MAESNGGTSTRSEHSSQELILNEQLDELFNMNEKELCHFVDRNPHVTAQWMPEYLSQIFIEPPHFDQNPKNVYFADDAFASSEIYDNLSNPINESRCAPGLLKAEDPQPNNEMGRDSLPAPAVPLTIPTSQNQFGPPVWTCEYSSQKGRPLLIKMGYRYGIQKIGNKKCYWKCTSRDAKNSKEACKAKVHQKITCKGKPSSNLDGEKVSTDGTLRALLCEPKQEDFEFIPHSKECEHSHPPTPGIHTALSIIDKCKETLRQRPHASTSKIVDQVFLDQDDENQVFALPKKHNVKRKLNRIESKKLKEMPEIDFKDENYLVELGRLGGAFKNLVTLLNCLIKWISVMVMLIGCEHTVQHLPIFVDTTTGKTRHDLFYSPKLLELEAQSSIFFMDGSFKNAPPTFLQVFIISGIVKCSSLDVTNREDSPGNPLVPIFAIFMRSRRAADYEAIFKKINDIMRPEHLKKIRINFERGLWNAAKKVWTNVRIQGCNFHYKQAILRGVSNFTLQEAYREKNSVIRVLIHRLMGLCYLPAEFIRGEFETLESRVNETKEESLIELFKFFRKTWLDDELINLQSWSVYSEIIRTTEDIVEFHQKERPSFYWAINFMANHIANIAMSANEKAVKEDQNKHPVKENIYKAWKTFKEINQTPSELLDRIVQVLKNDFPRLNELIDFQPCPKEQDPVETFDPFDPNVDHDTL